MKKFEAHILLVDDDDRIRDHDAWPKWIGFY